MGVFIFTVGQVSSEPIRIVISYRRLDTAGHAGHLHADLVKSFGEGRVFLDIDSIEGGADWRNAIEDAIVGSDVLIALIGRGWLTATDKDGRRKVDSDDDPLRFELQLAMERKIRVVPVLVQGAQMPDKGDLPESLRGLSDLHAVEISDRRWGDDVGDLVRLLARVAGEKARRLEAPDPAVLEEERARREAADRDMVRRREEAVLQHSLREEVARRKLRERDLLAQLEARDAESSRSAGRWRMGLIAVGAVVFVVMIGGLAALRAGEDQTVDISATMWQDTGIDLERDDRVCITAEGMINTGQPDPSRRTGPAGIANEEYVDANIVKGIGHGALIARIGEPPVASTHGVGDSSCIAAGTEGRLYLGINDDDLSTNTGSFSAKITVTAAN